MSSTEDAGGSEARAERVARSMSALIETHGDVPADLLDTFVDALTTVADGPVLRPETAARVWSSLGFVLKSRYLRAGPGRRDTGDLDRAIVLYRRAIAAAPAGRSPAPLWGNLAQAYLARCLTTSHTAQDERDAVSVYARALDIECDERSDVTVTAHGVALLLRSGRLESDEDLGLEVLTASLDRALRLTAGGSEAERECAYGLAMTLCLIRQRGATMPHRVELAAWQLVLATHPARRTDARAALYELGEGALGRFHSSGSAADLDLAIDALGAAAAATAVEDPPEAGFFGLLGFALRLRAESDRPREHDLDDAVTAMRTAWQAGTTDEERQAAATQLAALLLRRFEAHRQREDLDETIEVCRAVTGGRPKPWETPVGETLQRALTLHAELTGSSSAAVAAWLFRHYARDRGPRDDRPVGRLKRAFHEQYTVLAARRRAHTHPDHELAREADELAAWLRPALAAADPGPERTELREELIDALAGRLLAVPEPRVLDQLIAEISEILVEIGPQQSTHRLHHQLQLGVALAQRFEADGREADIDVALATLLPVAAEELLATDLRLGAAVAAGRVAAAGGRWRTAADAFASGVELLPQLAGRQLAPDDVLREVFPWSTLASDAAATAVRSGAPDRAIELLERGRGLLIGRALDARGDLPEVVAADPRRGPALAAELRRIGAELAHAPAGHPAEATRTGASDVDRRRALVKAWEATVERIRALPGCAGFLAPVILADLLPAATAGPVVAVNVSRYGSHALVLTEDGVAAVPLPLVTVEAVDEKVDELTLALPYAELAPQDEMASHEAQEPIRDVLAWLWAAVVEPVVAHLRRRGGLAGRMWWVPTGMLTTLPLHAAGPPDGPSLAELTVPSYAPTVRSLARAAVPNDDVVGAGVALVAVGTSDGQAPLPGLAFEVDQILRRFPEVRRLVDAAATVERVSAAIRDHAWLHLACHATSNADAPADSELNLHGSDRLTVRQLLAQRASGGRFVYLSACETVRVGNVAATEVISIGTAFQAAGFPHVVGTLWRVTDGTATETARLFYEKLGTALDPAQAAAALHHAARELRRRYPGLPTRWAAYTHIGP
ncbi:CHAT domain-containing protein [Asanoa sp. WMMD1127]|uniref:CHAT domain-containing protein n=1 Tax=Asanoa sp. WMMD1127 TaxID=3016107 RepID=UPI002417A439|nr:CHAT domain-containing protein [Asanoa sp. WMMD1127]MDG4823976.1 CHAT domain-containing protein [Asanoa sp. WMMD1127]